MKFKNYFLVYLIVWVPCVVLIRVVENSFFWIVNPFMLIFGFFVLFVIILGPYILTAHIFYVVFRHRASPIWLVVPVVMVSAFLAWAIVLTNHSNSLLTESKRAHHDMKLSRSETCLEFTAPVYDGFKRDMTRYLPLSQELREVSRDAVAPSTGCLLVRRFEDIEISEGKFEYMFVIEGLGADGNGEEIGRIHWGHITYPKFPPIFNPSGYSTVSGSAGGVKWFSRAGYSFIGPDVYADNNETAERLNYRLAIELGRVMGRKIGPYVRNR